MSFARPTPPASCRHPSSFFPNSRRPGNPMTSRNRFLANLSIGTRLFALAGVTSLILLLVGWLAIDTLHRNTLALQKNMQTAVSVSVLVDDSREAQSELVTQWKEWK